MKYLVISMLLLSACGKSSGSGTQLAPTQPGRVYTSTQYTLTATRSYPGNTSLPATSAVSQDTLITVPAALSISLNASEAGRATLVIGSVQVYYYFAVVNGTAMYVYHDATGGYLPGVELQVSTNQSISLSIDDGYVTQTTSVYGVINGRY